MTYGIKADLCDTCTVGEKVEGLTIAAGHTDASSVVTSNSGTD